MGSAVNKERRSIALDEETVRFYNELAEELGYSAHFLMQSAINWFKGHVTRNPSVKDVFKQVKEGV